jgi:hypothetical protein
VLLGQLVSCFSLRLLSLADAEARIVYRTRGLDASSALDYAKSLRILTDVHQIATFVSLYQASEGIFELFDKILLIDDGVEVYFGPASEARAYMVRLAGASFSFGSR